jgi:hypothetical protein
MTLRRPALLLAAAVFGLAGCMGGGPITASSTCHTSDGQFVNAPGCTISYSTSRTVTTTTTTTTTTTAPSAEPQDER